MKALILAAGYGNRMKPLTYHCHKTLLKIAGKTIIERIIDGLYENNIEDIYIVTGYRSNELINFLRSKYSYINFHFIHNDRYEKTNNIYSVALAFEVMDIDDDIILIESDLIYDPTVIKRVVKTRYRNVAVLDKWRSGMDGTVVTISSDKLITNIIPSHLQTEHFDFTDKYKTLNIYRFSKEFCNTAFRKLLTYYARVINDNCYYELILGILIYVQQELIFAEVLDGEQWAEVDDPNDLRVAEFVFNNNQRLAILEDSFGGYWSHDVLDYCFIRNVYFPTTSMFSEIKNNLTNLLQNYGSRQDILNQKLAYFLLYKTENLNILNGASQIFPLLGDYLGNAEVLLPSPTFGEYPRMFKNHQTYSDQIGINLDDLTSKIENAKVIVFVNPNNPTGSYVKSEELYNVATSNSNKIFIIDESFIDFSDTVSIIDLLENKPLDNILVIKSLSKCLGIPGARLGYVYSCNQSFNDWVRSQLPIWNINSVSEFILEIILKHRKELKESFYKTIQDRKVLVQALSNIDMVDEVHEGGGNFVLVKLKADKEYCHNLVNKLIKDESIYLKDVSNKFKNDGAYIRIAVRSPEENQQLVETISRQFK